MVLPFDICWALTPEEVVVIANKMAWHSCDLAKYYMKKRGIPLQNFIELKAPAGEHCSRDEYEKQIAAPVRTFLKKNDPNDERFKCLVIMFGLPLRVASPQLTSEDQKRLSELNEKKKVLLEKLKKAESEQNKKEIAALKDSEAQIGKQIRQANKASQGAAVDSELALVREEHYSLDNWVPNKFFVAFRNRQIEGVPQKIIMVSRLDGPNEEIVRRLIDDSLQVEKQGLHGTAYFDARWPDPGDKKLTGYAYYDRAIHNAAQNVKKNNRMPFVIDSQEKLFSTGQCPNAALYCGWYSLSHYVDAFTWARGAVGYHIASGECGTLKGGQAWCKMMLEKGVAATLGPVSEPYVQAFPPPDLFFSLLLDGRFTLAECYALSNPFWSWQMVLIGDPLYCPFKVKDAGKL